MNREALALIKQGCIALKYDKSKIPMIQLGMEKLNNSPHDDLFTKLICGLCYEKMSMFHEAIAQYSYCIDSLPDSSIKYAIEGMKYRALAKESQECRKEYTNQSIEWYSKALEIETIHQWKRWWEASIIEVQRMK